MMAIGVVKLIVWFATISPSSTAIRSGVSIGALVDISSVLVSLEYVDYWLWNGIH